MLLVLATILVTAWPVTDAAAFHPGHKVLPHLPRTLKNRLRHTPLLNLPSQPDSSLCGAGAGAEGLRAAPSAYGGDPTGRTDSTVAVQKAVAFCVNASTYNPNIFSEKARDALGCTVDLEGGEFLISEPLIIPTYVSNMRIQTGSLIANPKSSAWHLGGGGGGGGGGATAELLRARPSAAACTAASFPVSRNDQWCQSLVSGPATSHASPAACMAACCSAVDKGKGCDTWQWCSPTEPCAASLPAKTDGCWLSDNPTQNCKSSDSGLPQSVGWIGASVVSCVAVTVCCLLRCAVPFASLLRTEFSLVGCYETINTFLV